MADRLLNRLEVADMFRVSPETVSRWGRAGKLETVFTPGGQRRYMESEVRALLGLDNSEITANNGG